MKSEYCGVGYTNNGDFYFGSSNRVLEGFTSSEINSIFLNNTTQAQSFTCPAGYTKKNVPGSSSDIACYSNTLVSKVPKCVDPQWVYHSNIQKCTKNLNSNIGPRQDPVISCPANSTPENNMCRPFITPTPMCASGYRGIILGPLALCGKVQDMTTICPSGYVANLKASRCIKPDQKPTYTCPNNVEPTIACPSGSTLQGGKCVFSSVDINKTCPSYFSLQNDKCVFDPNLMPR